MVCPGALSGVRMLAGRWRLDGWQWRRAKPAVVVCALYDYTYRAEDGRQVAMAAGEQFLLLHKANEDWWQVRRAGEPHWARPFFVPAAYVAELDPGDTGRWSTQPPSQPEDTGERGRGHRAGAVGQGDTGWRSIGREEPWGAEALARGWGH